MELIGQEVSPDPEIEIPDPVRDVYRLWRPTPLFRARRLEQALDTPARIYYKYEGVSPAGSHKPNSAVPQAYATSRPASKRLVTETGAGQWGSALALACSLFGLECEVYMVGASYDQKPYRRAMMETWGATVHPLAVSDTTEAGRAQASHPTGSLGIAISEAVEVAAQDPALQLRARLRAQPRLPAPDGDRPGGDRPDGDGGRASPTWWSAASAAARTSRGSLPVRAPRAARRGEDALRGGRAGGLPDAHARRLPLRLRRHRRA